MKVVTRATFLELPPGTVYAKFGNHTDPQFLDMGPLCIKTAQRGDPPLDWYALQLPGWPAHDDTNGLFDVFDELVRGADLPPDLETGTDDGLFDQGQRFIVLSEDDVKALVARLLQAIVETKTSVTP